MASSGNNSKCSINHTSLLLDIKFVMYRSDVIQNRDYSSDVGLVG